ncbi:hypothetical protein [Bradyrhizobium sp. SZCCHNR3118]|uniref:hypothetical protein n=1 Tax=Bradyrhizobium sp. SZCCHNR3118 TaxID=3057468 RepID=UPI00291676CB|nr:hypothetical protein [Bradyrhizobium sp. SZCCHNR3118]
MRDPFLNVVLPFLADELAKRGETPDCSCPSDGPCLGDENQPNIILVIQAMNADEDEGGFDPGSMGFMPFPGFTTDQLLDDPDDLDDEDEVEDFEDGEFVITAEGIAELERQQKREAVEHLGKLIDNMVYIVGMYTSLVQGQVEA